MNINIKGTLVDPLNKPSGNTIIRVEALDSVGTFKGAVASVVTAPDGAYDFSLVHGSHRIEVNFDDEYVISGEVLVDSTVPSSINLTTLLSNHKIIIPEESTNESNTGTYIPCECTDPVNGHTCTPAVVNPT